MSRPFLDAATFSRRTVLGCGVATLAQIPLTDWLFAESKVDVAKPSLLNRFPRMMQDFIGAKIVAAEAIGTARRAKIASAADAESYVKTVRELISRCFGSLPDRTPLNPRIMGIVERDGYRIEKVIFESRPEFLVTANLYVPKGRKTPMPGVVACCGHSVNGKASEAYQSFAQGLARLGYVVLIFDPIGQGERFQYPDEMLKSTVGAGVHEHLLAGNQQFLIGEFLGTWRAWDGIRALDYLLSRREVDPQHVGITGNSGGGTMTMWLCGLESRWTMAAPSCSVTTFRRNFENELPTDTEQCPPNVLLHGLDHSDFLVAMAPKPVMILAAEKDYFDVRGAIEAYERVRPIYKWLGAENNIRLFIGPNEHGYTLPNREAMYQFFNQQVDIGGDGIEPKLTIESDQTLWCTPRGQVSTLGSKTVISLTAKRCRELQKKRSAIEAANVRRTVDSLIPERPHLPPDYQILRPLAKRNYPKMHATYYAVETEPQVRAIVARLSDGPVYSRPPRGPGRAVLYVSHVSSDIELREEPLIRQLIEDEPQSEFYALDVRGIGDSQPQTCGENQFLAPYGSDYFYAAYSIMLGLPYPFQRAFDVLRVIDWIRSLGRTEIHLAALAWGTIPATLAAIISEDVHQVTLKRAPRSFSEIAEAESYDWPLSSLLPNVLTSFDLPDCYRSLAAKQLKQIDPVGSRIP